MKRARYSIVTILLLALLAAGCNDQPREPKRTGAKKSPEVTLEAMGAELYNQRCRDCHRIKDKGGSIGPDLSHIGSKRDRAYLEQVIREPAKVFPGTVMPPGDSLSAKQIDSLVNYLDSLK